MNQFASPALVLVLWGHGCNETVAAGFVSAFRQQGTKVTLVGISGRRNMGAHGLTLLPDILLSEALALADAVDTVVLPCSTGTVASLDGDPRLRDLCQQAQTHGARFIVCEETVSDILGLDRGQVHLFTYDLEPFSFVNG